MDNCAGQNKNRMVIWLLFILVRLKLCVKARMVFLVKGHTKNDCDRMFNLMKQRYRNTNCYTPKDLMEFVANSNEDVELVDVMKDGGFKDWDKYQNKYMKAPESIQNFHVFQVTQASPNRLMCQEAYGYPFVNDDSVVRKQYRNQQWGTLEDELQDLQPLGVKDIKWITLYDEWRPLIPADNRKDYVYFHNDPGPERRQKSKLNREEAAETRKKRTTTIDNAPTTAGKKRKTSPGRRLTEAVAKKNKNKKSNNDDRKPAAKKKAPSKNTTKKSVPKRKESDKPTVTKRKGPFQFGKL
jgi:hypothetical protein